MKKKRISPFSKDYVNPYGLYSEGPRGNPDQWRATFQRRFTSDEIKEILKDESPWGILGLTHGATRDQIKAAYRRRAMETHPDRNPGMDGEEFKKVNAAYQKLNGD
jgi:DnaJ-class molecular chaperone